MTAGTAGTDITPKSIDRDPNTDCNGPCGRSFGYLDYWEVRYTLGDPRRALTLCDDYLAAAIRYHDRVHENRQLTEFVEGTDD